MLRLLRGRLGPWLIVGTLAAAATLAWAGYRAVDAWRDSARLVAERRAESAVNLLVTAITRDMRGVQTLLLGSAGTEDPADLTDRVASAFARYPYPELFFAWRASDPAATFFTRANRPPAWLPASDHPARLPVLLTHDAFGEGLLARVADDAALSREYSLFDVEHAGATYQVVARLTYADRFRERLEAVFGFLVNLDWVRQHYFHDLAEEVSGIEGYRNGLTFRVFDAAGTPVVGPQAPAGAPSRTRTFPLVFFDPAVAGAVPAPDLSRPTWKAEAVVVDDATLNAAQAGAQRTLIVATIAGAALALGVLLIVQAGRANAKLTRMRTDFILAITHELKTPIASIRAMSQTLASGRPGTKELAREYGQLTMHEAQRLGLLIDNLFAHARITDLTGAYAFDRASAGALVDRVVQNFASQLDLGDFDVDIEVEPGLPPVFVDRQAMELALGNLIDNAIRYSDTQHALRVTATAAGTDVVIRVADRGVGIPADELKDVKTKFFRGRGATPGGSGLGLAIAERIITDHAGTLEIESRVGEGTTAYVRLPAHEAGPAAHQAPAGGGHLQETHEEASARR